MRIMYKKQCTCTSTSTKYSLHSIVEDDVRGCLTSTKYWIPSILEDDVRGVWLLLIMSQKALSNTEHLVRYGYYYNHKTMVIICSLKFYI